MKRTIFYFFILMFPLSSAAQVTAPAADTIRKDALNVYMGASDFIKKEIQYVNYVRDIRDADVYIISASQQTGSGGREYTFYLTGQNRFTGMSDTISFVSSPDDTEDRIRSMMVNTLKMGLMRYVAKTPLSKYIKINFTEPLSETVSTDKWNSWVFRASFSGYLDGEKSYKSSSLNGNLSANRVTRDWKINLSARYGYSVDKFEIYDNIYTSKNNSESFNSLIVRSINDHWSYGGSFSVSSSSYNNTQFSGSLMPGIEYDIFPYSESTRRQLRILYRAGYNYIDYRDSTIYDKMKESLWLHSLSASYEVIQKWGSIDITLGYSNYLHDWSKNNLSVNGYLDLRIAKGLSVSLGGGASLIHDQLGLVKGGATTEEVLLRRRELETQFQYWTMFGFTYTFGSIYNNVVNPRFGDSGGGGMTMSISY